MGSWIGFRDCRCPLALACENEDSEPKAKTYVFMDSSFRSLILDMASGTGTLAS